MTIIKAWIISMRLRTLPLSLSTILTGSVIAYAQKSFNGEILIWAALTTLFLQILSNLANDYGDAKTGADNENRVGPKRMIQQGTISLSAMKKAMALFALLSLVAGLALIVKAFETAPLLKLLFLITGIAAIAAAIKYTAGKNPYGYRGLGDLFVFLFFGVIGVAGTWFLHTNIWQWEILLPATTIGLFSTGVLNINNIRDIESDKLSGKKTIVVRMGKRASKWYHAALIAGGWLSITIYIILFNAIYLWPVVVTLPLFIINVSTLFTTNSSDRIDSQLRFLSISTLLFVLSATAGALFLTQ
ncbi:1,4-dihydroxy-2-naphthoate octaprenyltransferase [Marinilabiliaceae bacterium ANBcel2]|nr:1,4-dihydroxy-2-naphthoate octaprenyltransferase [Marinilabiliaceae bacterium ANBcel2]